jgi:two-component system nitrogen regulation response regulator GlnG
MLMPRLLVVDDEPNILHAIQRQFQSETLDVAVAQTGRHGLELVREFLPDVVLLDVRLRDMSGMEVLDQIRRLDPRLPVILVTAFGGTDTAIEAMKRGAFEYLLKPVDLHQLREVLERALELSRFRHVPAVFGDDTPAGQAERIVGQSPGMQEVYKAIGRVASRDVTVLIIGESGTGKELIARALFHHSARTAAPFLAINCAAIPETLLESELFGHERGAFTGAERRRIGKFEQADGGTLFLDEIGDMSAATQAKVLRLIQEQRFERLGGNETIQTNVRLLAATNKDLEKEVVTGRFRKDLLYRLNVFTIRVPPLRERREDIPLLIEHFLPHLGHSLGRTVHSVTPEAQKVLYGCAWPGNIRQLQSVLKYAIVQGSGDVVTLDCLPENLRLSPVQPVARQPTAETCRAGFAEFIESLLRAGEVDLYRRVGMEMDRAVLEVVLRHVQGNQVKASELLGISRTTLRAKLRALNLDPAHRENRCQFAVSDPKA